MRSSCREVRHRRSARRASEPASPGGRPAKLAWRARFEFARLRLQWIALGVCLAMAGCGGGDPGAGATGDTPEDRRLANNGMIPGDSNSAYERDMREAQQAREKRRALADQAAQREAEEAKRRQEEWQRQQEAIRQQGLAAQRENEELARATETRRKEEAAEAARQAAAL